MDSMCSLSFGFWEALDSTAGLVMEQIANIIQIFPLHRSGSDSRRVGPGVEMRADPVERRRRNGQELDMLTAME
jgi:hypothetical protein